MSDVLTYKRGQVWLMRDTTNKNNYSGCIQKGTRPVLIFSSDQGNRSSPILTCIAITSKKKPDLSVNVEFTNDNNEINTILSNQIIPVEKPDLYKYLYTISDELMSKVEKAHKVAMGIVEADIDNKIDEIYKLLEDLAVIKSNSIHDTSRDEQVIRDTALELQRLYADMLKYHDSTAENLRKSIPALNDSNAKIRMGLPYNIGTPITSESSSPSKTRVQSKSTNNSNPDKETVPKKRKTSENRKPSGYWTNEKIKEFISDKNKLPLDEWMKKYEYTDRKTIMKAYYTYSSKLNRIG